jgi:hypothetical protein
MREPGNAVARTIATLVTDWADSLSDPQRAIMLAYADPVGSSPAVTKIMHAVVTTDLDSVTVYTLGHAASCIGDFELADMFLADAAARLRAEGRLQVLARAVVMQAWARLRRGQWSTAMPLAEEGSRLAEESGQAEWLAAGFAGRAMVAALRGPGAATKPSPPSTAPWPSMPPAGPAGTWPGSAGASASSGSTAACRPNAGPPRAGLP